MGAPTGNEFWRLRKDMSEDGRKLSRDEIIERAQEYIDRCVNDKLYEVDYVGKDAIEVERPKMISMSIYGLCHWLGIAKSTWEEWMKDEKYSDVTSRVNNIMRAYNIEGSSAGLLNHNIIVRLEGLADKQDITSGGEKIQTNVINIGGKEFEI